MTDHHNPIPDMAAREEAAKLYAAKESASKAFMQARRERQSHPEWKSCEEKMNALSERYEAESSALQKARDKAIGLAELAEKSEAAALAYNNHPMSPLMIDWDKDEVQRCALSNAPLREADALLAHDDSGTSVLYSAVRGLPELLKEEEDEDEDVDDEVDA